MDILFLLIPLSVVLVLVDPGGARLGRLARASSTTSKREGERILQQRLTCRQSRRCERALEDTGPVIHERRCSHESTAPTCRQPPVYNDTVVRQFALMTVVWGVVGMLVGVFIAAQLAWPELNFGIPWLSYGRLRPLHTNAVIFAFGGCALFATCYYVVQRTCQVRLFARQAGRLHLLGLAAGDRGRGHQPAAGLHQRQGIRRAGVADRHPDHAGLGGLRRRVLRHHRHAQGAPHLRGQLVLRRLHHHRGAAAHRQQRRHAGRLDEVLLGLRRRAGRDGAVVVRPQRGGLLPDRRLPRDDVLLRPEAGRAAGVLAIACRSCTSGR